MESSRGRHNKNEPQLPRRTRTPVTIPPPLTRQNSRLSLSRSAEFHQAPHLNFNPPLSARLHFSSPSSSSDDDSPQQEEQKEQASSTTILNFLNSSAAAARFTSPRTDANASITPSPQLDNQATFHIPPALSIGPTSHVYPHSASSHPNQEAPVTVLNILSNSPVTLKISSQFSPPISQHNSPIISSQPPSIHLRPATNSNPTSRNHSPRPLQSTVDADNRHNIQIILPNLDPQLEWSIDLTQATAAAKTQQEAPNTQTQVRHPEIVIEERYYRELLLDIAYHLLLIALVSPNAMNAFCEPSGVKPAELSKAWWDGLSTEIQLRSIMNALFSLGVNVFVQRDFIPLAWKALRDSFSKCFDTTTGFFGNVLTLISSAAAAFSFAGMAYDAFRWTGKVASVVPGLFSLWTSFTTRYPNVKNGTQRFSLIFNKEMRFQKRMADKLRHLKADYLSELQLILRTNHYKLNGKEVALALDNLGLELEGIPIDRLLEKKTNREFIKEYASFVLESVFATLIASTALQTFTQKGFDGANAISHLFGNSLDHLSRGEQLSIGATGGLVSGLLYFVSALNFLPTFYYVANELLTDTLYASFHLLTHPLATMKKTTEDPKRFIRFLKISLGLIANWYASSAMVTVGNGVVANKRGIFQTSTLSWKAYANIFPQLNGLGGIAINTTATINQILKAEKEERRKEPQAEDLIHFLETTLLPENMPSLASSEEEVPIKTHTQLETISLFSSRTPASVEMSNRRQHLANDSESDNNDENDALLGGDDFDADERPVSVSACEKLQKACSIM